VIVSAEAKAFKKAVSSALQGVSPVGGPVALTVTFYRPRRSGDIDNFCKVTLDSLKGIAYEDDSQIVELHAYRKDDKANPRVEISVTQLAPCRL
jgi:Holliday junction resolvase RusA-like endonuclease